MKVSVIDVYDHILANFYIISYLMFLVLLILKQKTKKQKKKELKTIAAILIALVELITTPFPTYEFGKMEKIQNP